MRLDINLATHPYEDPRHFWLRWGGALAGLILLTMILVYSALSGWYIAAHDRTLLHEREQQIADRDLEERNAQALLNRPENRTIRDRSQFLNDAFQRKAFSWTKVFEDLEKVMPARLHVVSIHPEMSADHPLALTLEVAGESHERAIELVRNMEDSRHFKNPRIVGEISETTTVPGDNVKFNISSLYVPETTADRGAQ
jgi:Tfp pilus assembly protein PilN